MQKSQIGLSLQTSGPSLCLAPPFVPILPLYDESYEPENFPFTTIENESNYVEETLISWDVENFNQIDDDIDTDEILEDFLRLSYSEHNAYNFIEGCGCQAESCPGKLKKGDSDGEFYCESCGTFYFNQ